jgi:hypothetical protein
MLHRQGILRYKQISILGKRIRTKIRSAFYVDFKSVVSTSYFLQQREVGVVDVTRKRMNIFI